MSANYYSLKYCLSVCIKRLEECQTDRHEKVSEVKKYLEGKISAGSSVKVAPHLEYIEYQNGFAKSFDVLEKYCVSLFEKLGLFYHPDISDGDLDEAVSNVIWADHHLEIGIPQFHTIVTFLKERFGSTYVRMAKKNSFSNVSNDLILMKRLSPPTITLNELLNISDKPEQDHLNWFKYLFRIISRSNSSTRSFDSTE